MKNDYSLKYNNKLYMFGMLGKIALLLMFCQCNNADISEESIRGNVPIVSDTLTFTTNESFFSPVGTLSAHLVDKSSGEEYNKFEFYDYIYKWKQPNDTILFGVTIQKEGNLFIHPEMSLPDSQDGSELYVYLNDERKSHIITSTGGDDKYEIQNGVEFVDVKPGFYMVKLQIKMAKSEGTEIGQLKNVHLIGSAVKDAKIEMRRYRPFAVHGKWQTESTNPVEICVHELTVMNRSVNCYQPITTPFGYTGSPWSLDTRTFGGYNFSLWSYGQNDQVPPFYQESHLIAVGPGLTFGAYGHEGTGVKPRGNHPYMDVETNTQVVAVRMQPGEIYNTYWSYYLDPVDSHWKLYGCGKKYNKTGATKYLETGAFVEVAGPASTERSGHELRETQYRGWQMDTDKNWYPINKLIGSSSVNELSYRNWRTVGNKFSMQMGGWGEVGTPAKTVTLSNPDPVPYYLKGDYLAELYRMPATFEDGTVQNITANSAELSLTILDLGTNAQGYLFWGREEGLTKEDKWENNKSIEMTYGKQSFCLEELQADTEYYYRIKIKNDQGITWSFDTQKFRTLKE
ncbi:DUF3472 domain-containing protein [Carboxylicivirga sediminis]|uniref:DUF3472 domain-containing protein n=1 Tax=Carboxylicivirga sediminis TaxID=2006564 RepID=A0A941IWF5_9BACT|nr:DUF3472 domain-containing protein [Carboxylicivirga sediminis]MBR8535155.1 DUF3472 domain-containing protein [Carboxylicivirga sediminis]